MLILPHSSLLNDGLLNAEDALEKKRQETYQKDERYRLPGQEELTNVMASLGSPTSHTDFIKKVEKLSKQRIWTEDSLNYTGGMNWYTERNGEKVCLGAPFLKGYLPEFDVIHTDERNLPNGKTPGWRNVLSQLIVAKVLTKTQVDKAFGIPISDRAARWHKFTREYN
jgi:hypothetical protein